MLWRDPNHFWLLGGLVALAVVLLRAARRRQQQLRPFADETLAIRLESGVDRRRRALRLWLRLAALALLVLGLAGPKWGFDWQEVRREGIDLIVALDTSRSMLAEDVKPNRLERAKLAVLDLVSRLEGDRVGLVAFAGTAFLECPLTLDYAAFERSLRSTQVGIIPRGGTSLARAIEASLQGFEARQGKYEALILITDGEDNEGGVDAAAAKAAELGVKVFTVGIGTGEGELVPAGEGAQGYVKDRHGQVVKSRLSEGPLQDIALKTGGAYVRGLGPALGLDQVFEEHIAKMERRDVASSLERRYEERFQIPLAAALFLLVLETLLGDRPKETSGRRRWLARGERTRATALLLFCLMPFLVGWFDPPNDRAAEGNRLYESGKYDEAEKKFGEGLVDAPESELLRFNMAAALYKQGKYDEAIAALGKVASAGDPAWVARASYNLGNAQYRLGANAEQKDPQAAIASWEQALVSYKRAMSADPSDSDAKFNHEVVTKKLHDLRERLEKERREKEEQQKQQEQEPQQEQQEGGQESRPEPEEQAEQQEGGESPQESEDRKEQQQAAPDEGQPTNEEQQAEEAAKPQAEPEAGSEAGLEESGQAAEAEAARAVLDTAAGEELGPEEVRRPVGVADIGEPAEDW